MLKNYLYSQFSSLFLSYIKSVIITACLYVLNVFNYIEKYFFGSDFLIILTILIVSDSLAGMIKHILSNTFHWTEYFKKFALKFGLISIATVSAKSIIDIDNSLNADILVVSVKLMIALYLFGNINKNLCRMTNNQLCFTQLIQKIKELYNLTKSK